MSDLFKTRCPPAIGLNDVDWNAHLGSGLITIDVLEGEGFGGSLLGSETRALAGLGGFQLFSFTNLFTTPGSVYSFRVSSDGGRGHVERYRLRTDPTKPGYLGGHYLVRDGRTVLAADLTFKIEGTSTVPEPMTLSLLAIGLAGAGARRWRRTRA